MKALCWHSPKDIRCDEVPDPQIEHPRDAIIKVTSCAICGSDLHLYDGYMPGMENGDVMGHEFMGEVVEVGKWLWTKQLFCELSLAHSSNMDVAISKFAFAFVAAKSRV